MTRIDLGGVNDGCPLSWAEQSIAEQHMRVDTQIKEREWGAGMAFCQGV